MLLIISESLLITSFAMFPSLLLSFLIYDYASIADATAIFTTVCIMLLFSVISAWYPAWKVSKVNPAEALQYE
jgi:ABC-type lipoprotein release transport system permease subunit